MRPSLFLPALTALAAAACVSGTSGSVVSAASPSSTATAAATATSTSTETTTPIPTATAIPIAANEPADHAPRLADADVATLEAGLKCTPGSPPKVAGPCKVLVAMKTCSDWESVASSGDDRWIGHGWQATGTTTVNQVTILRSRTVPPTEVKPWQLPVKIAVGVIGKDAGRAFAQADVAINAYAHHAGPPTKNAAVDLLKQKSDWTDEAAAARTMGSMVETFSDHPTYLCQGADQQIELVQQASGDIGLKSDGLYAELWPVSP